MSIKKKLLFLLASLALFSYAQDTEEYVEEKSSYEVSSNENEDESSSETAIKDSEVAYDDSAIEDNDDDTPKKKKKKKKKKGKKKKRKKHSSEIDDDDEYRPFAYGYVHPMSFLFSLMSGDFSLYVTGEFPIHPRLSFIGRPAFMYDDQSQGNYEASMVRFDVFGGARYYIFPNHQGPYLDGLVLLRYASLSAHNNYDSVEGSAFGFGLDVLAGWKFTFGRINAGADLGIGYVIGQFSESITKKLDIDSSISGFSFDINIYVGLSF